MRRTVIGITIGYEQDPQGAFLMRKEYVRAVEKAGGLPVIVAPGRPEDALDILDTVGALVLTGGSDVDPALYGQSRHPSIQRVILERDTFELALCREALHRDVPVLAICRGQQVLNVAAGGTLVQDIPSDVPGAANHDPDIERWETAHEVEVLPGTKLREILGKDRVAVNSFHHQAVRDLGKELIVSARSTPDQIVEGIEAPDRSFVVGVQWHPEAFWNREPDFQSLFEALVKAGSLAVARRPRLKSNARIHVGRSAPAIAERSRSNRNARIHAGRSSLAIAERSRSKRNARIHFGRSGR